MPTACPPSVAWIFNKLGQVRGDPGCRSYRLATAEAEERTGSKSRESLFGGLSRAAWPGPIRGGVTRMSRERGAAWKCEAGPVAGQGGGVADPRRVVAARLCRACPG
ncbi:hypothetical protein MVI01_42350 [Myxococcus virescens]|uniref:Uncharacterized protein n=1 Tax=Myxococcus virescens TaxID=83456 RepID=A0A511HFZ1_9BACT|nr:hypothetical protein MVI01_42350 [Myxococcus virescens]